MNEEIKSQRQAAAAAGRAYLAQNLSWDQFMERFEDSQDELVGNLVDLIEHEPQRGGFLGIKWPEYQAQLSVAIEALES